MADQNAKIGAEILKNKAISLVEERDRLRIRICEDAALDMQISRDITACIQGASALGYPIEVPGLTKAGQPLPQELTSFVTARNALLPLTGFFQSRVEPDLIGKVAAVGGAISTLATAMSASLASAQPMPRVSDVVLERLRAAGDKGCKAAEIRNFILQTYHKEIHEKTVGMTLFRLHKAKKVRRDGHTWFLAS